MHDGGELGYLFGRDLNGGFHDKPGDAFTARWGGQRPIVVIILGLTWEEILGIDAHVRYRFLLIDVSRKLLDERLQESVRFAWLHEHPHDGELALVIFMDEMDFHGILLTVH